MAAAYREPGDPAAHLLGKVIEFPDGQSFERLGPITDLRRDPEEARILYYCKKLVVNPPEQDTEEDYVLKVKFQVPKPDGSGDPTQGPSETTAAEIEALTKFKEKGLSFVPHLVASTQQTQDENGYMPGGFISLTVMTRVPGPTIWDMKFWGMEPDEREKIRGLFLEELKQIWALGIAPYDCALRNILWDRRTQKCSIVDFEHWERRDPINAPTSKGELEKELQRWGIVRKPPPPTWAHEWGLVK